MHSGDEFLQFLNSRGIQLGLIIQVISREKFDGSVTVRYEPGRTEMFTQAAAEWLAGEKI
jgi:hypothetical protein